MSSPFICGFGKFRNEIIRSNGGYGNIYLCLENLFKVADTAVLCDDASTDGTTDVVRRAVSEDQLVLVPPGQQDFDDEIAVKQRMLEIVHRLQPTWIYWVDGDEVLDRAGTADLAGYLQRLPPHIDVVGLKYCQFWRNTSWQRTDQGFDSVFYKIWRWRPDLHFQVVKGLHRHQFPEQVLTALNNNRSVVAPFAQLHYGNVGVNLRWKNIQYHTNPLSIARHLNYEDATYQEVDQAVLPDGAPSYPGPRPVPFTPDEKAKILSLSGMRDLPGRFVVVISTYNRATTLPRTLQSLIDQQYGNWVALVLDDGSTDHTQAVMREWTERDPRIFYCRYPRNRGGVAVNEIGMALACEVGEFWTRCGSDDWYEPTKLLHDVQAFQRGHSAVYGLYQVVRGGKGCEVCNLPESPDQMQAKLLGHYSPVPVFVGSWVNIGVRTSVLRRIKEKYGNFVDPRLKNMEDFCFGARLVRETPLVWRGIINGEFVVGPDEHQIRLLQNNREVLAPWGQGAIDLDRAIALPEAYWTVAADGASSNLGQTATDDQLSRQIILEENAKYGG